MAEDVKIFDGTNWKSLKGAEGPTVVSADVGNVAKLGTDGKLLVNPADLDSRFVNLTGDTMTGNLNLERDGTTGANALAINVYSDAINAVISLRKTRGTKAAQTPCLANDFVGRINFNTIDTAGVSRASNINCQVVGAPTATGIETSFSFAVCKTDGTQAQSLAINKDGIVVYGGTQGSGGCQATYVNTAIIQVSQSAYINGPQFHSPTYGFGALMTPKSPAATSALAGYNTQLTDTAPSQTSVCYLATHGGFGKDFNAGYACSQNLAAGTNNYAFYSSWEAQNYFKGFTGINWSNPTSQLEVGGSTKLRGTLDVTGNITSTGTAHSFAAKSIPASAINGVPSLKADDLTDVTVATPATGQVLRWNGTAFVNAALNYSDLTGTAPSGGLTQAQADARYVELTGDIMTGTLTSGRHTASTTPLPGGSYGDGYPTPAFQADIRNGFATGDPVAETGNPRTCYYADTGTETSGWAFLSTGQGPSKLGGNLKVLGASNSFLRASINGDALADRPITQFNASRTLALSDRSTVIANTAQLSADVVITIPTNLAVAFPIGTTFTVADLSIVAATILKADSSVTLNWNATLTGGAAAVAGGVGASLTLPGPLCQVTLIKTATNTWMVLN